MTITKPLEYITINGIQYKTTPIKTLEHIQVVTDFDNYLNSLDAEIYNKSLEEYGKDNDLKIFSTLYETEFLNQSGLEILKSYIKEFKKCVNKVVKNRINELINKYLNNSNDLIEQSLNHVNNCVKFHENNNLTDSQEFINWEDKLNAISCKEHPEHLHDWLNYKNVGIQLEQI